MCEMMNAIMRHTDEELWNLCINGDKSALEELYKRFYPTLVLYGEKLIIDKEIVKDCIQELFVKLIRNHHKLKKTLYVKSYLLKALRNTIFDFLKKMKNTEDISLYENSFLSEDIFPELFPDEETTSDSHVRILMLAYKKLPSRQQEIIYLYYISDLKHEEIADILGINYQSSKNLLFRSLSNLRNLYSEKK